MNSSRWISKLRRIHGVLILPVLMIGCASAPTATSDAPTDIKASQTRKLTLSYQLGQDLYRVQFERAETEQVRARYLARWTHHQEVLRETHLEEVRFEAFLEKVTLWSAAQRQPADNSCRNPYSVTLELEASQRVWKGCRSSAEGSAFSRLMREAEFLLSSPH